MAPSGVKGESLDKGHDQWIDVDGGESSKGGRSSGGSQEPSGGSGSSGSSGGGSGSVPPAVIAAAVILGGLLLMGFAVVATLAITSRGGETGEEMILEPEEVSLDEGSAMLNVSYSTESTDFFDAVGSDEIELTIKPNEDSPDQYDVEGTATSVQKIRMYGMDGGVLCPIDIEHDVKYTVKGIFYSSECTFGVETSLVPEASQLVAYGCSVNLNFDPSPHYIAPEQGFQAFVKAPEQQGTGVFKIKLHNVNLPRGVNCPAFSNR